MQQFKSFIHKLAEKSQETIMPYYNSDFTVEIKGDESPVTQADKNAEAIMREMINKEFPSHGIIGEEYGSENENAEFVWVLDPIDGTVSFVSGCPLFGTLICLLQNGKPVLGAINMPVLNQFYLGDNNETSLNGKRVMMRDTEDFSQVTMLATDLVHIYKYKNQDNFNKLLNQVRVFRTWGDCYAYTLLSSGKADIVLDAVMKKWDIMALIPVVRGANGIISSWEGGEPDDASSIIAASRSLHPKLIEILNT